LNFSRSLGLLSFDRSYFFRSEGLSFCLSLFRFFRLDLCFFPRFERSFSKGTHLSIRGWFRSRFSLSSSIFHLGGRFGIFSGSFSLVNRSLGLLGSDSFRSLGLGHLNCCFFNRLLCRRSFRGYCFSLSHFLGKRFCFGSFRSLFFSLSIRHCFGHGISFLRFNSLRLSFSRWLFCECHHFNYLVFSLGVGYLV